MGEHGPQFSGKVLGSSWLCQCGVTATDYKGRGLETTQESFSPKVVGLQTGGSSWLKDNMLWVTEKLHQGANAETTKCLSSRGSAENVKM